MMKKYIIPVLMAVCAVGAHADSFNWLVFRTADGVEQPIGLADLVITFEDGELRATSQDESLAIPLATLKSMAFSNGESGIESVVTHLPEGRVTVFNAEGQSVGMYESATEAFARLAAGVYIIKAENGLTTKIMIAR